MASRNPMRADIIDQLLYDSDKQKHLDSFVTLTTIDDWVTSLRGTILENHQEILRKMVSRMKPTFSEFYRMTEDDLRCFGIPRGMSSRRIIEFKNAFVLRMCDLYSKQQQIASADVANLIGFQGVEFSETKILNGADGNPIKTKEVETCYTLHALLDHYRSEHQNALALVKANEQEKERLKERLKDIEDKRKLIDPVYFLEYYKYPNPYFDEIKKQLSELVFDIPMQRAADAVKIKDWKDLTITQQHNMIEYLNGGNESCLLKN